MTQEARNLGGISHPVSWERAEDSSVFFPCVNTGKYKFLKQAHT